MTRPAVDGVLLVDKPVGVTSHDVVSTVRRAVHERRVGHAGTLDPFATGLLIVLLGRATRLLRYLDDEPKVYEATIRFGAETDTDDLTGEVIRTAPLPDPALVERALADLTGEIEQVPPAYSAKRVEGRRAYDAARRGTPLELAPARVTVHEWRLRDWRGPELDAVVMCGTGTYIRSLARDLGRLVGSAAHLCALRRVRSGAFDVRDAASLDAVREGHATVCAPLRALPTLPVEPLDQDAVARVARGMRVPASIPAPRAALVDGAMHLVALGERDGAFWQPRVVLRDA
ncbi:MAG TPA: tRNA pseudouridine(55) synthase TruB [Gemmatimonadaceae bacterium]